MNGLPDSSKWTDLSNSGGVIKYKIVNDVSHSGSKSVYVDGSSYSSLFTFADASKLPTADNRVYVRTFMRVGTEMTQGHSSYMQAGPFTKSDENEIRVGFHQKQLEVNRMPTDAEQLSHLNYWNDGKYGVQFAVGQWYCVETYFNGRDDELQVWVDGQEIPDLHVTDWKKGFSNWSPSYQSIAFGYEKYSGGDAKIWYDDIAIGTQRIGCGAAAPTPPPTTSAFTCPAGLEGETPALSGKTLTLVANQPTVAGENRFLEGPVWLNGNLYVSQLRDWGNPAPARILKLTGTQFTQVQADNVAGTNGLALRADGKIIAASQRTHGLIAIDPTDFTKTPVVIANQYNGAGFNSPNDLTLRDDGNIYFTDPDWNCGDDCPQGKGNNRVYRVSATGAVEAIEPPHNEPNGIALSPDQNKLYVAGDSAGIVVYDLDAAGQIGSVANFNSQTGVDGMTVDCAGNIYASVHADGVVKVFTPNGSLIGSLSAGEAVTNVAFGGVSSKTLYVTTKTAVKAVILDVPGYPY